MKKQMKEEIINGVVISEGIAIGNPLFLAQQEERVPSFSLEKKQVEEEINRYRMALQKSRIDIEHLQKSYDHEESGVIVDILSSHLEMLQDPMVTTNIEEKIKTKKQNSEKIITDVIGEYRNRFQQIKDRFFRERIKDVDDVSKRILRHLIPIKNTKQQTIPKDSIAINFDLVPSDTYEATYSSVLGFISQSGGHASHAAIIARARRIPYIAQVDVKYLMSLDIKKIILDGCNGRLIVNPSSQTVIKYKQLQKKLSEQYQQLQKKTIYPLITQDRYPIKLYGNIETVEDTDLLHASHGDGIGLFRSEYLFLMEKKFPSEEKQFQIYKEIVKQMDTLPFVVRLFDIGNDKNYTFSFWEDFSYQQYEINPSMGCRALRFLLQNKEVLKQQLRAILRASRFGNIHILIPFVTDISEIIQVKTILQECREELKKKHYIMKETIHIGCMIEVPSSALMSAAIAKEVDFLSIGTNDLTQYVLAVDRCNPHINHLYHSIHPSVLNLIYQVAENGRREKTRVIVCGEMAAIPLYIPLIIGMGITELSVSVRHIPVIKEAIRCIDMKKAKNLVKKVLNVSSVEQVENLLKTTTYLKANHT